MSALVLFYFVKYLGLRWTDFLFHFYAFALITFTLEPVQVSVYDVYMVTYLSIFKS